MSDMRVHGGIERRSRRLPVRFAAMAVGVALAIAYATLCPIGLRPHLGPANAERLAAHAVLGFVLALTFRRRWALVTVALILFAVGLEAAQHLIPGRHSHLGDALVKALGGLMGSGLGYAVFPARRAYLRLLERRADDRRRSGFPDVFQDPRAG